MLKLDEREYLTTAKYQSYYKHATSVSNNSETK